MESQIYLLVVVVIIFMGGAGCFAVMILSNLQKINDNLAEVDRTLKTISGQISTEVRPELGAINRNTRWNPIV